MTYQKSFPGVEKWEVAAWIVKTDNNPLTYIMSTPNLDATGHCWVSALAKYDFWLEYQKG